MHLSARLLAASMTVIGATAIVGANTANAQYVGPGATAAAKSVAEIVKNPVDDQLVVLQGKLIRKTGKDSYLFSDGSGEIRVEIDDKLFNGQKVSETTVVEISGEVDKKLVGALEIDVDKLDIVTH